LLWALGAPEFEKHKKHFLKEIKHETLSLMNRIPLFSKFLFFVSNWLRTGQFLIPNPFLRSNLFRRELEGN
jgi:hypothetical protein